MKQTPLKRRIPLQARKPMSRSAKTLIRSWMGKPPMTPMKTLDSIVSKVVRLGSADSQGMVYCVTCGRQFHWKVIQCGHFQKRGNLATRYDMKNLGPQCEDCNCFKDGKQKKFGKFIDKFYGEGTAEKLKVQARQIIHNFPFEQEIIKWGAVLEKIVANRNGIEY